MTVATSVRGLLAELITTAGSGQPSQSAGDDAAVALGQLGRALAKLRQEGLRDGADAQRDLAARRLAAACAQVGEAWAGIPGARLTDLAGVTADAVGVVLPETTTTERWATALRLGTTSRHLVNAATAHGPYRDVPELAVVREAAHVVRRLGAADPEAAGYGHVALDRPIPSDASLELTRLDLAATSAITLADQLRRHVRASGPGLSVSQALVTLRACEAVTARAVELYAAEGAAPGEWRQAVLGWRTAWMSLRPLRDGARAGTRPGGDPQLARCAIDMARAVWSNGGVPAEPRSPLTDEAQRHLRILVNQLPRIADQLELAVRRWGATGQVCAYANHLPFREDAPTPWLRHQVITLAPRDLEHAAASIRSAGMLSAAVAVHFDATRQDGPRPQPHLTASFVRRVRPTQAPAALTLAAEPLHAPVHRTGPRR